MLAKDIIRIVLYGVGLSSLGCVIYLAGPFIAFGDWHPLENHIVREIAILLLTTASAASVASATSSDARTPRRSLTASRVQTSPSTTNRCSRSA